MIAIGILKTVHVLAAIFFLGFGLASFFYKALAWRSRDPAVVLWCDRQIVLADWIFTVPAGLTLPTTGAVLVLLYGLPWSTGWIAVGLGGYVLAALTWLPAARLQLQMRAMAERAVRAGTPLPDAYGAALRAWGALGIPSFAGALATLGAMVTKWTPF